MGKSKLQPSLTLRSRRIFKLIYSHTICGMRIVEDFQFTGTRKGVTLYPYEEWLDGKARQAVAGTDFLCKPESFQSNLRNFGRNDPRVKKVHATIRRRNKWTSVFFRFDLYDDVENSDPAKSDNMTTGLDFLSETG
jgi:hypothetical protein